MSAAFLGQFQKYLVNQAEFSENEKKEFRWRQMAFRAFALIVLVLGVPAWWLTTTPYRAHLPSLDSTYAANLQQRLRSYQRDGAEVWDNLELHSNYNLHFIFIIDGLGGQRDVFASREIERKIAIFTQKYLQPIGVKVRNSAEFLWDFSLDDFLLDHSPNVVKIIDSSSQIPASLATQLDMLDTPPVRQDPLLKIAIFFSTDRESSPHRIEHKGQPADGLAIASWGAIFVHDGDQQKLLNAIMASLLLQLSIAPSGAEQPSLNETLKWHQQRLALHNLLQTVQILNSLHELASTIEDLVISDEVASLAAQSQAQFLKEYNRLMQKSQIDSESAAQARRLAERANGDQSLLELLNFPSDQKYGIYVPLFLPLLVPLLQPLALFLLFLLTRLKAGWRNRKNNNNSEDDMGEKKTK